MYLALDRQVLFVLPKLRRGGRAAAATRLTPRFIAVGGRCGRDTISGLPVHCVSPYRFGRSAFTTSSSKSGGDNEETVPKTQPEVEKLAQEGGKDLWGNRGKLIYEGSIAHQVRGLKR